MRVVIELKRNEVPEVVLKLLRPSRSQLQDTFGMNVVALVDGCSPSIIERYVAFNTKTKPPTTAGAQRSITPSIKKSAKVAFSGYAVPATGSAPEGVDYAKVYEPYDPKKAPRTPEGSGLPERLHCNPLRVGAVTRV